MSNFTIDKVSFDKIIDKDILVRQIRGLSGLTKSQKLSLRGLGLKKVGSESSLRCSKSIAGMLNKVAHLVEVSTL